MEDLHDLIVRIDRRIKQWLRLFLIVGSTFVECRFCLML